MVSVGIVPHFYVIGDLEERRENRLKEYLNRFPKVFLLFASVAITKKHRLGGLNNRILLSHRSRG